MNTYAPNGRLYLNELHIPKLSTRVLDTGGKGYHVDNSDADPTGQEDSWSNVMRAIEKCILYRVPLDFGIGSYIINGEIPINSPIWIRGAEKGTTIATAASLESIFHFKATGSRIVGGGITDINAIALTAQQANGAVARIDSSHGMTFKNISANGFKRVVYGSSNQYGNSEGHVFDHLECMSYQITDSGGIITTLRPDGTIKLTAGSTGTISDCVIGPVRCEGGTGHNVQLIDVHRMRVFSPYMSANNVNFLSNVCITNNSGAAGAYANTGQHQIYDPYLEDDYGSGTPAKNVIIDADSAASGRLLHNCVVFNPLTSNPNRTMVYFDNSSSHGFINRNNTAILYTPSEYAGWINIATDKVYRASIEAPYVGGTLFSNLYNSGTATAINRTIINYPAGGAGALPDASHLELGFLTTNGYDGQVFTINRLGQIVRLTQPTLKRTSLNGASTNSWIVTHGTGQTLAVEDVQLQPGSFLGHANYMWVDSVDNGAGTFTIKSDVVPGTTIYAHWRVLKGSQ